MNCTYPITCYEMSIINNNNNNNDKVYTPLSEKCSQSRVFISQCHIIHIVQYYVLASMVYVALRQITVQYQMQLSDENTSIHSNTDRVTNITVE